MSMCVHRYRHMHVYRYSNTHIHKCLCVYIDTDICMYIDTDIYEQHLHTIVKQCPSIGFCVTSRDNLEPFFSNISHPLAAHY